MANYSIVTDIDRCVGCHACTVACKAINDVPVGRFWNRVLRVGPTPKVGGSGQYPDVEMYFLNVSCQHCADPECIKVCPTGASFKAEDGTVQVDHEACIGCEACLDACPYGVRYINADTNVAEKCTMCAQALSEDDNAVPQCVSQCGGNARWVGDIDEGYDSFVGAFETDGDITGERRRMMEFIEPFTDDQVYRLPDLGNGPQCAYILRGHKWYGNDGGLDPAHTAQHQGE